MDKSRLISNVIKPARYIGGEPFCVVKDQDQVRLNLALVFPEIYEIAMSHQGLKVLYNQLAPRADVSAERVFCPWHDLMDVLYANGEGPWSLETGRGLADFDAIGFSLQYELTYTNLLHMLKLAGIPLRREDRGPADPVIIAGGPCAVNPEPLADFLDLAAIGDGEAMIGELCDLLIMSKDQGWSRDELYHRAMDIPGVYAPALFLPVYQDGRLAEIKALDPAHTKVQRRIEADLGAWPPPQTPVLPLVKPVHDRLGMEISRGCTRGCRFCQAGFIYRPVRERPAEQVVEALTAAVDHSGLDETALLSLSAGDYTCIEPLAAALMNILEPRMVSISLPSLRVDSLSEELIAQIKRVRKTGFTLAPEAGSDRMRSVINKDLSKDQILETAQRVFGLGWNLIKLYFMIGLPGETEEDILAIGELSRQVAALSRSRGRKPVVHSSIGIFVPKPHTPFQWESQLNLKQAQQALYLARGNVNGRVKAKWNDPYQSVIEGIMARGDRRLGPVLEHLVEAGCRFDGWSEQLDYSAWMEALESNGLRLDDFLRPRDLDEVLPWDHIDVGVTKKYLKLERKKALEGTRTADCRGGDCSGCGVCDFETIQPKLAPTPPRLRPYEPVVSSGQYYKYRFRLEKTGQARFIGHLEMMTLVMRAFRHANAPLAFTQGFNPQAKVKACSALPLGVESLVEVIEITTTSPCDPADLAQKASHALPQGMLLADGRTSRPKEGLAEPDSVTYQVRSDEQLDRSLLEEFIQADAWPYTRFSPKGSREMNFRQTVRKIEFADDHLLLEVGREGGRPKPAEVLESIFGLSPEQAAGARALKIQARWGEN